MLKTIKRTNVLIPTTIFIKVNFKYVYSKIAKHKLNKTTYTHMIKIKLHFAFLQVLCLYHVGVCYLCFDNILCIINLHTAGQFRILQYRLENMCGVNNKGKLSYSVCKYMKLKTYIQQHQMLIEYCKKLEQVFNLIVLGQVSLFSLLMCLDGYLVLTVCIVVSIF